MTCKYDDCTNMVIQATDFAKNGDKQDLALIYCTEHVIQVQLETSLCNDKDMSYLTVLSSMVPIAPMQLPVEGDQQEQGSSGPSQKMVQQRLRDHLQDRSRASVGKPIDPIDPIKSFKAKRRCYPRSCLSPTQTASQYYHVVPYDRPLLRTIGTQTDNLSVSISTNASTNASTDASTQTNTRVPFAPLISTQTEEQPIDEQDFWDEQDLKEQSTAQLLAQFNIISDYIAFYKLPLKLNTAENKLVKSTICTNRNGCTFVANYGCGITKERLLCKRCYRNPDVLKTYSNPLRLIDWTLLTKLCLTRNCKCIALFGILNYSLPLFCKNCYNKYPYEGIRYIHVLSRKCSGGHPGCSLTEAIYRIKGSLVSDTLLENDIVICKVCRDTNLEIYPTLQYEHFNLRKCKHIAEDGTRCDISACFNFATLKSVAYCSNHKPVITNVNHPMYGIPIVYKN